MIWDPYAWRTCVLLPRKIRYRQNEDDTYSVIEKGRTRIVEELPYSHDEMLDIPEDDADLEYTIIPMSVYKGIKESLAYFATHYRPAGFSDDQPLIMGNKS
jgi:hypothetical protein